MVKCVEERGCPKSVCMWCPMVFGSRKVCKDEGVSKEWCLWRPVEIGSGVIQCKSAQSGPVAIGSRKSVWRPRGDR